MNEAKPNLLPYTLYLHFDLMRQFICYYLPDSEKSNAAIEIAEENKNHIAIEKPDNF